MNIYTKLKSVSKNKIVCACAVIVFIIFAALTIALLVSPVFKGTYSHRWKTSMEISNITFYDNTYTQTDREYNSPLASASYGFYSYTPKTTSAGIDADILSLSNHSTFVRNSVFSITRQNGDAVYTCYGAIVLQVFYAVVIIGSVVVFICFYRREKRQK